LHFDYHNKRERVSSPYLQFDKPVRILITSGASCPDAVVESIIRRLAAFFGVQEMVDEWPGLTPF
jgi:4-hydroxy-3-methylbut-2-enyl diphosphate reductase